MKTIEIERGRDDELETKFVTTAMNTPNGCIVRTMSRYSSSAAITSDFIPGYNYTKDEDGMTGGNFTKLDTIADVAVQEGKNALDKIRETWRST